MFLSETWSLISLAGPMAIPLLIASICSLAVIIEKIIFFATHKDEGFELIRKIEQLVEEGDILEAYRYKEVSRAEV